MGIALLLALGGLAIWVAHLVTGSQALAWWASAFLVVVALLGVTMLARWIPVYRAPIPAAPVPPFAAPAVPAERNFPLVVVLAHGVLGASALLWCCWPPCSRDDDDGPRGRVPSSA